MQDDQTRISKRENKKNKNFSYLKSAKNRAKFEYRLGEAPGEVRPG